MPYLSAIMHDGAEDRVLISDGYRSIRLDVRGGYPAAQWLRFHYHLTGRAKAEAPLLALRQFLILLRNGRFSSSLHPPYGPARRQVQLLRTYDALRAGSTQRAVACHILSNAAVEAGWRLNHPSLRSQAQRLVSSARHMAGGAFRMLLSQ